MPLLGGSVLLVVALAASAEAMCAGWCSESMCTRSWKCTACGVCAPRVPPAPPAVPDPPTPPSPPATPPLPAHPPTFINPFANSSEWFIDGERQEAIAAAIEGEQRLDEPARARVRAAFNKSSAVWLDSIASVARARRALATAAAKPTPPLVVFVVYNLPNRDCAASASSGELCCMRMPPTVDTCQLKWGTDCEHGLARYRDEFLAPIATLLRAFATVPVALVLEPDSLPNLVTSHTGECRGRATSDGYKRGVALAARTLAPLAAATYLDAGHGTWPGLTHTVHASPQTALRHTQCTLTIGGWCVRVAVCVLQARG
jgi:cellulose 1,4-beta-cellobiosidase